MTPYYESNPSKPDQCVSLPLRIANQGGIPEWFAVHCVPNHERRIAQHLTIRQLEHFCPSYRIVRRRSNGLQALLEAPLFPTYIFAHIMRNQRVRVLEVPGVLSIVGNGPHSCPIPDREIDLLRKGAATGTMQPHPYLHVGDRVRIKSGVLAGFHGVLVRYKAKYRVVITIEAVMKSVSVEADAADLEPAIGFLA